MSLSFDLKVVRRIFINYFMFKTFLDNMIINLIKIVKDLKRNILYFQQKILVPYKNYTPDSGTVVYNNSSVTNVN